MAATKTSVGKALAGLNSDSRGGRATPNEVSSERIVAIPEIAVFSELPFASQGTIGGTGINIISSSSGSDMTKSMGKKHASDDKPTAKKAVSKPAVKKARASKKMASKTSGSNGSARRAGGRKKAR